MKKINVLLLAVFLTGNVIAQDAETFFAKGEQLKQKEDYKGASEAYTKAIELDPENVNAMLQRAFCYNVMGDYEKSISDYSKIISLKPDHKFSYLSRGSARNKLKKYKEAIGDFDKVITLDPDNQEAYNNRGFAKMGLDDKDGACKDWNKSKKLGNSEAKIILKNNKCK